MKPCPDYYVSDLHVTEDCKECNKMTQQESLVEFEKQVGRLVSLARIKWLLGKKVEVATMDGTLTLTHPSDTTEAGWPD